MTEVADGELQLLLDAIARHYGYDLRGYAQRSVRRRAQVALAKSGLPDLGALREALLDDPRLMSAVLDELTVRTSEFFRDPSFFRTFRERVVPILRTYPLLRVWHGGCSSGEEAYSMAILLSEEGLYEQTQIYATDVSPRALDEARQGIYSAHHLAQLQASYRAAGGHDDPSRYYTAAYDRIAVKESLRRNILFFQHDLVADHVFAEMHVVLCRNVFIYFGPELRERVLDKFRLSLCPNGFLCLGRSERLPMGANDFSDFAGTERIFRLSYPDLTTGRNP